MLAALNCSLQPNGEAQSIPLLFQETSCRLCSKTEDLEQSLVYFGLSAAFLDAGQVFTSITGGGAWESGKSCQFPDWLITGKRHEACPHEATLVVERKEMARFAFEAPKNQCPQYPRVICCSVIKSPTPTNRDPMRSGENAPSIGPGLRNPSHGAFGS